MYLRPTIRYLTELLDPIKIYRVNHGQDGKQLDPVYLDLLVILKPDQYAERFTDPILKIPLENSGWIRAVLHDETAVLRGLSEQAVFYCLQICPGNLIYEKDSRYYPETSLADLALIRENQLNLFEKYWSRAAQFFDSAKVLLLQEDRTLVGFFLHQALEGSMRALLLALTGAARKTHELYKLIPQLNRYAAPALALLDEQDPNTQRLIRLLDRSYLESRYSPDFQLPQEDIFQMLTSIERVRAAAESYVRMQLDQHIKISPDPLPLCHNSTVSA